MAERLKFGLCQTPSGMPMRSKNSLPSVHGLKAKESSNTPGRPLRSFELVVGEALVQQDFVVDDRGAVQA